MPPQVQSRGGTLVTRAYIKESNYSCNIQSVWQKKISICLNRGREESVGNDDVMKTENFEGTGQVDFVTFIVHSYFDTLLRYLLSVTFCGAVGSVKVMDQKTLVKRR